MVSANGMPQLPLNSPIRLQRYLLKLSKGLPVSADRKSSYLNASLANPSYGLPPRDSFQIESQPIGFASISPSRDTLGHGGWRSSEIFCYSVEGNELADKVVARSCVGETDFPPISKSQREPMHLRLVY
ncbi:hypothetical protein Q31a_42370 [Aureliella helgolandensis]|uniref:Uncharacterized protein n=2 Tax=Aureliella helgolandensis TaxID=2527968 RepID=A0A518GBF0_9BACT|nr:hypothetical protein Q31a_42370 [Aureliella helgolandensis]